MRFKRFVHSGCVNSRGIGSLRSQVGFALLLENVVQLVLVAVGVPQTIVARRILELILSFLSGDLLRVNRISN